MPKTTAMPRAPASVTPIAANGALSAMLQAAMKRRLRRSPRRLRAKTFANCEAKLRPDANSPYTLVASAKTASSVTALG